MKKTIICLVVGILCFSSLLNAQTLNLVGIKCASFSAPDKSGPADEVMKEAFSRSGLDFDIILLPAERAKSNVNMGIDDGVYPRVINLYEEGYDNIIRVPENVWYVKAGIFTKNLDIVVDGWESLKDYHVAVMNGWKTPVDNLERVGVRIAKVDSFDSLIELLESDRVDMIFYIFTSDITTVKLAKKGIYMIDHPLVDKKLFLYLNKKHKALVPSIDRALKEMKVDGTYQKILKTAYGGE